MDRFSKMVHFAPCKTTLTAKDTMHLFMQYVFRPHGLPEKLITDRGTQFASQFNKEVEQMLGLLHALSTAYHPESDGQTERVNRVLEELLRHYTHKEQQNWDLLLPAAEFAVNRSKHASTQFTPFQLNIGYNPSSPFDRALRITGRCPFAKEFVQKTQEAVNWTTDMWNTAQTQLKDFRSKMETVVSQVKRNLAEANNRQAVQANKHRTDLQLTEGQWVLLSTKNLEIPGYCPKLKPRWVGPFEVTKVVNPVAYRLKLHETMRIHNVFHVSLLKPYRGTPPANLEPVVVNGQEEYLVDSILNHRTANRKGGKIRQFLVQCQGFGPEAATWEPEVNLTEEYTVQNSVLNEYLSKNKLPRTEIKKHR